MACHRDAHLERTRWAHARFVCLVNIDFVFTDGSLQVGQEMDATQAIGQNLACWPSFCHLSDLLDRILNIFCT